MTPEETNIPVTELSEIVLPSGRRVEISYVDGEPFAVNEPAGADTGGTPEPAVDTSMIDALDRLTICGSCGSMLVQPRTWRQAPPRSWQVELRCPECEGHGSAVVDEELAEQLTLFHERARALVEVSMLRLASENAEREIDRFARALETDLILPEDF